LRSTPARRDVPCCFQGDRVRSYTWLVISTFRCRWMFASRAAPLPCYHELAVLRSPQFLLLAARLSLRLAAAAATDCRGVGPHLLFDVWRLAEVRCSLLFSRRGQFGGSTRSRQHGRGRVGPTKEVTIYVIFVLYQSDRMDLYTLALGFDARICEIGAETEFGYGVCGSCGLGLAVFAAEKFF